MENTYCKCRKLSNCYIYSFKIAEMKYGTAFKDITVIVYLFEVLYQCFIFFKCQFGL